MGSALFLSDVGTQDCDLHMIRRVLLTKSKVSGGITPHAGKILFKNNITSLVFYPGHDASSSNPSARNGEEAAEEMAIASSSHSSGASAQTLNHARHFCNGKF